MSKQESANQIHSFSKAMQGGLWGAVLALFALVNVDLVNVHISFIFLPVAAVFFWPQQASHSWSLGSVCVLGLFYDLATAGPSGLWGLSLLVLFIVMGGGVSPKIKFWKALSGYAVSVCFVYLLVVMFGRIAMGVPPNLFGLAMNAIASIFVFPIVYWLRSMSRGLQNDLAPNEANG